MTDPRADIQKIEETIRKLQNLKEQGLLPADQADVSIAILQGQMSTLLVSLEGGGAIAQGTNAQSVGADGVLINGNLGGVFIKGTGNEVNISTEPRAKKESLREAYLSYVIGETGSLTLGGLVRKPAGELDVQFELGALYTGLRAISSSPSELYAELYSKLYSVFVVNQPIEIKQEIGRIFRREKFELVDDEFELLKLNQFVQDQKHYNKSFEIFLKSYRVQRASRSIEQLLSEFPVLWHVNKKSHLVILGDPGSGKSTFLSYLALCLAGEWLGRKDANIDTLTQPVPLQDDKYPIADNNKKQERQPWDHGALLPVQIILRDFAVRGLPEIGEEATAEHVWSFIEEVLAENALSEYASLLKKELRDEGGLLLLDGLDEVPEADQRREQIKQAIESFVASFPRCRFIVTSRTYAYQNQDWKLKGFQETELAPFTRGQIAQFIDRWYAQIARIRNQNREDATGKAKLLQETIFSNGRLMELAERPLLLALMAFLHAWRGGSLVEKREELYADAVDLLLDWWESQRIARDRNGNVLMIQPSLAEWLKVDRKKVRDLLNQVAYEAHAGQTETTGTADLPENMLITGLMQLSQNPDVKVARLIEYMRDRAGLLVSRGVGVYTFPHRTFQEYLAACYLTDHDYPYAVANLARQDPDRWREAALLAGAKAARGTADFALWALVDSLSPEVENEQDDTAYWGALIAGYAVVESANLENVSNSIKAKLNRLRSRLVDIIEGNHLPVLERAAAGNIIARLGDPRFNANRWLLPTDKMLGFVHIPSGKFVMGSDPTLDKGSMARERPQHEVYIPYDYYLARYPVTVAQYRLFVEESGYQTGSNDSLNGVPNHPVVNVSWFDAFAYCRWLDRKLKGLDIPKEIWNKGELDLWKDLAEGRLSVTLPSESEWEQAARGSDGRIYPWGAEFDTEKTNMQDTGIGSTSAVGCFPLGASPYGMLDMSGNTYEWTRSLWGSDLRKPEFVYPYRVEVKREDLKASTEVLRVFRGGSFTNSAEFVRGANRYRDYPNNRDYSLGFRLAVSPMIF